MATDFSAVIDCAFDKMKEYEFLRMGEEEAETVLKAYIRPACIAYSDKRGHDLKVDMELEIFKETLSDDDIELLGSYVCLKYIDANYIRTTLSMKAFLSGTDFHAYANKDVMAQVMKAQDRFKSEIDGSAVLRSYRDENSPFWQVHKNRRRGG